MFNGFGKSPSIADQVSFSLQSPKDWEEGAGKKKLSISDLTSAALKNPMDICDDEMEEERAKKAAAEQMSSFLKNPSEFGDEEDIHPSNSEEERQRRKAAKEMSSFLKDPSKFSKPEEIDYSRPEEESDNKSKDNSTQTSPDKQELPSLEECLYGPETRRSPYIKSDEYDDPSESENSERSLDDNLFDDSLNLRWQEDRKLSSNFHHIEIGLLRKLCSQGGGIPEEESGENGDKRGTCHRGVAWRVLLEMLPVEDIHTTWPNVVPPRRRLYRELVQKYMEDAIDPGRRLKGESHWEQSLRTNGSTDNTDNELDLPVDIRANEDILNVFPQDSKYRELWRKTGITLNQGESAAAIQMNRLRVPKELMSLNEDEDEDEDESEQKEDEGDVENENSLEKSAHSESRRDDLFDEFCKDAKLLSEIRKDVVRTNPHLRFYLETRNKLGIRRHAALERILFVWAKLNGNLYVQGMNEIVGTIYYVLAMDPTASSASRDDPIISKQHFWADHAEADTYFLFNSLLNTMEVRDVFVADLDHKSDSGLHGRIKNIEMLLKQHDPEVYNHLKVSLGMDTSFYAIRWLTTLLSREFTLPDTIRLWDSMLASTHKENFLRYVCATMVIAVRDRLLRGDFGTCLKLLQNYPSGEIGMDELLVSSRALWIFETQVSLACRKGGVSLRHALNIIKPPEGVMMAFGRVGGKPPKFGQQIRNVAASTVASPISAANNNVGKFMGRAAKQLWNWRSPSNAEKKIKDAEKIDLTQVSQPNINVKEGVKEDGKDVDNGIDEEWDLIDSIIEGKTEFVAGSMRSTSSISDSSGLIPQRDTASTITPTSSPERKFGSASSLDLVDDIEDYTNNDGSCNQDDDIVTASTNNTNSAGVWNRRLWWNKSQ